MGQKLLQQDPLAQEIPKGRKIIFGRNTISTGIFRAEGMSQEVMQEEGMH